MDGLGSPSFHDLDGRVKEPVEPWTRSAWSEKKETRSGQKLKEELQSYIATRA